MIDGLIMPPQVVIPSAVTSAIIPEGSRLEFLESDTSYYYNDVIADIVNAVIDPDYIIDFPEMVKRLGYSVTEPFALASGNSVVLGDYTLGAFAQDLCLTSDIGTREFNINGIAKLVEYTATYEVLKGVTDVENYLLVYLDPFSDPEDTETPYTPLIVYEIDKDDSDPETGELTKSTYLGPIFLVQKVLSDTPEQPTTPQFLDETGLRALATHIKTYTESRTTYRLTAVSTNTDSVDLTIEKTGGGS